MGLGTALTSCAGTPGIGFHCDPDIVDDAWAVLAPGPGESGTL